MKFFTASIPARLFAAFTPTHDPKEQPAIQNIYNNLTYNNYKNSSTNGTMIDLYSQEADFSDALQLEKQSAEF